MDELPIAVDGRDAVYTWSEQEVLAYQLTRTETVGTTTILTNSLHKRPNPGPDGPKNPGTPILIIEEYGTPLGVEIMINHVGDCFD